MMIYLHILPKLLVFLVVVKVHIEALTALSSAQIPLNYNSYKVTILQK